ncbi:MAG: crotonase/enoyl-CoA hydratase family protein [Alphaproteobacteria bacterium]|nr:crotonase/enoyl-CoA hydratase family protein [Alphaproteobacteria bacterium]
MSVRVARDGPVATLILDRPAVRNAVDRPTAEALVEAVRAADADPAVRALVLTGAGDTFCAGADLGAFTTPRRNRVAPDGDGPMGPTRLRTAKPVIAAIEGHAVAGGLELACWADLRVVADDAVLGVFCRRWGVPLIDGGTVRLPRLIGLAHALDLILTGRPVHADEALRIGLATRVVPAGTARAEAEALAHRLAAFPATCLRGDLAAARGAFDLPEEAALRAELERGLAALDDPETHAAVARFVGGAGRHGEGV